MSHKNDGWDDLWKMLGLLWLFDFLEDKEAEQSKTEDDERDNEK